MRYSLRSVLLALQDFVTAHRLTMPALSHWSTLGGYSAILLIFLFVAAKESEKVRNYGFLYFVLWALGYLLCVHA